MVLADLVQAVNNIIKLENIKIGVKIRKQYNSKCMTYTITDVNCRAVTNGNGYYCICFTPDYESSYTRFATDIDTFMSNYEIVK